MKCISVDGTLKRVSDVVAAELVESGKATYAKKADYRAATRPQPKKETKEA